MQNISFNHSNIAERPRFVAQHVSEAGIVLDRDYAPGYAGQCERQCAFARSKIQYGFHNETPGMMNCIIHTHVKCGATTWLIFKPLLRAVIRPLRAIRQDGCAIMG